MRAAIIPARGGSQRIKRKNIKLFHGYPMLYYAITVAKVSKLFDRIVVSTDDNEIGKIAYDFGAEYVRRSKSLAEDHVGTQTVAQSFIATLPPQYDLACVIYPCVPFLTASDLQAGLLAVQNRAAYSMSVGAHPLRDAGAFYWGYTKMFMADQPLIGPATAMVPLPEERVLDINTEADFKEAEERYARMMKLEKVNG